MARNDWDAWIAEVAGFNPTRERRTEMNLAYKRQSLGPDARSAAVMQRQFGGALAGDYAARANAAFQDAADEAYFDAFDTGPWQQVTQSLNPQSLAYQAIERQRIKVEGNKVLEGFVSRRGKTQYPTQLTRDYWPGPLNPATNLPQSTLNPTSIDSLIKLSKRGQLTNVRENQATPLGPGGQSLLQRSRIGIGPEGQHDIGMMARVFLTLGDAAPEGIGFVRSDFFSGAEHIRTLRMKVPGDVDISKLQLAEVGTVWSGKGQVTPVGGLPSMDMGLGRAWDTATLQNIAMETEGSDSFITATMRMFATPGTAASMVKNFISKNVLQEANLGGDIDMMLHMKTPQFTPYAYYGANPAEFARALELGGASTTEAEMAQLGEQQNWSAPGVSAKAYNYFFNKILPEKLTTRTTYTTINKDALSQYQNIIDPELTEDLGGGKLRVGMHMQGIEADFFLGMNMRSWTGSKNRVGREEIREIGRYNPALARELQAEAAEQDVSRRGILEAAALNQDPTLARPDNVLDLTGKHRVVAETALATARAAAATVVKGPWKEGYVPNDVLTSNFLRTLSESKEYGDRPLQLAGGTILPSAKTLRGMSSERGALHIGGDVSEVNTSAVRSIVDALSPKPANQERAITWAQGAAGKLEKMVTSTKRELGGVLHARRSYGSQWGADPQLRANQVVVPDEAMFQTYGVPKSDREQFLRQIQEGSLKVPGYVSGSPATIRDYSMGAMEVTPMSQYEGVPTSRMMASPVLAQALSKDFDGDFLKVLSGATLKKDEQGQFYFDTADTPMATLASIRKAGEEALAGGRNPLQRERQPTLEDVVAKATTLHDVDPGVAVRGYRSAQQLTGVDYNLVDRQLRAQAHTTEQEMAVAKLHQGIYNVRQIPHTITDPHLNEFTDILATYSPRGGSAKRVINERGESVRDYSGGYRDNPAGAFTRLFTNLVQAKDAAGNPMLSSGEISQLFSGEKNRARVQGLAEDIRRDPDTQFDVDKMMGLLGGAGSSAQAMLETPMGRMLHGKIATDEARRDPKRKEESRNRSPYSWAGNISPEQQAQIRALQTQYGDVETIHTKMSRPSSEVVQALMGQQEQQGRLAKNVGLPQTAAPQVTRTQPTPAQPVPVTVSAAEGVISEAGALPVLGPPSPGPPVPGPIPGEHAINEAAHPAVRKAMAAPAGNIQPVTQAEKSMMSMLQALGASFGGRGKDSLANMKDAVAKLTPSVTGLVKAIEGWSGELNLGKEATGKYTREAEQQIKSLSGARTQLTSFMRRTQQLYGLTADKKYEEQNLRAGFALSKLDARAPDVQQQMADIEQRKIAQQLGFTPPGGDPGGGGPGGFGKALAGFAGGVGTHLMSGWGTMQLNRLWGFTGGAAIADMPIAAQQEMAAAQAAMAGQPGVSAPLGQTARGLLSIQAKQAAYRGEVGQTTYRAYGEAMGGMMSPTMGGAVGLGAVPVGLGLGAGLLAKWGIGKGLTAGAMAITGAAALPVGLAVGAGALAYGAVNYMQDVNRTDLSTASALGSTNWFERTAAEVGGGYKLGGEILSGIGTKYFGMDARRAGIVGGGFGGAEETGTRHIRALAEQLQTGELASLDTRERTASLRAYYERKIGEGAAEGPLKEKLGYLTEEQYMAGASQYMAYTDETSQDVMTADPMFEAMARRDITGEQMGQVSAAFGGGAYDAARGYKITKRLSPREASRGISLSQRFMQVLSFGPHAAMSRPQAGSLFERAGRLGVGSEGTRQGDILAGLLSGDMETVAWGMEEAGMGWMQPGQLPMEATAAGRTQLMYQQRAFQTHGINESRRYQGVQFGLRQQGIDLSYQGAMANAGMQRKRLALSYRQTMGDKEGAEGGYVGRFGWREQQMAMQQSQFMGNWALQGAMMGENQGWQRTQMAWQEQAMARNRQRTLVQRGWEDEAIDTQEERGGIQRGWQLQGLQISQEMAGISRAGTEASWAFSAERGALQFGWQQEDITENIRYASGRQRKQLMTQQERATTMYNMEQGQADESQDRQKEIWELEDQRFAARLEQIEQEQEWAAEDLESSKEHRDEKRAWEDEDFQVAGVHFEEQKKHVEIVTALQNQQHAQSLANYMANHALQMAQMAEEKKAFIDQHNLNIEAAGIQAGLAEKQRALAQAGLDAAIEHTGIVNALADAQRDLAWEEDKRRMLWLNFMRIEIPNVFNSIVMKWIVAKMGDIIGLVRPSALP